MMDGEEELTGQMDPFNLYRKKRPEKTEKSTEKTGYRW